MPANHTDVNLLFGIIALQMDFVGRDALIEAMQAWTLDKSKHLGDILLDQDQLTLERRALLEELVQEHLKQHRDDPAASLGAAAADSSVREALQSLDDADIHAALTHASQATPQDTYATRQAPAATELEQRFRVLRPHAQGGLGQVSVALDKELQREVALKELQMKFAGSEVTRERFLIEAAVTGGLEHPGIVPVYGLGHYSDGRPYYAMRFIRGDNLTEAIDRFHRDTQGHRTLELRKLLRRFIDVCDAIQYAHSRGILHRDLKPGNIMLGKYGETLVVDWGLAKHIDSSQAPTMLDGPPLQISSGSGSTPTSMGSVIGTPGYMSPEQASGRLDLLGPATDVYGLGATLYHLLTGVPPFRAKASEVLKKVERGEFKPPREVRADVPPALQAICLKAMATRPSDRYESAFRLAEDIERWLSDEPVSAWPEPATVRAGRWMRRHTPLVSSVAAAACVGVLVIGASYFLLRASYEREQGSHAQARQVVDDYFTQVSEETLLNQPGLQGLRRDLLIQAAAHYERFAGEHRNDVGLQAEVGRAHFRLGVIRESIDMYDDAIADYDRAASIQQRLASSPPPSAEQLYDLGLTLNARGRVLQKQDKLDEAGRAFADAIKIREQAADLRPGNVEYARTLANSYMNYGEALHAQGMLDEARRQIAQANDVRAKALQQAPEDSRLRRDTAKGHYNLANLFFHQGDSETAEQHLNDAAKLFDQLRAADPIDPEIQELSAQSYRRIGDIKLLGKAYEDAAAAYERALEFSARLAFHHPQVRSYREEHAANLIGAAAARFALQQGEAAVANYQRARDTYAALAGDFPEHGAYRVELASAQVNLGRTLLWMERPQDAATPLRQAVQLLAGPYVEQGPLGQRWIWAEAHHHLGIHEWSLGELSSAAEELEAGQAALASLIQLAQESSEYAQWNIKNQTAIAALYLVAQQQDAPPRRALWEAKAGASQELLRHAAGERFREGIAQRLHTVARLQWAAQQFSLAEGTMRAACEQWDELASTDDVSAEVRAQTAAAIGDLAALLLDIADRQAEASPADAKHSVEEARELLLPLVEAYPDDEYYRRDLQAAEQRLGELSAAPASE